MRIMMMILLGAGLLLVCSCGLLGPSAVNAGYYIENKPDSKTTIILGSNNSQANAIHSPLGKVSGTVGEGESAEANKEELKAKSSGLFVNNAVGDRVADVDATAALEVLRNVKGSSAGQAQTTSKGDESPSTGTQSQTPVHTETRTIATPVAVGQQAPTATATQNENTEP